MAIGVYFGVSRRCHHLKGRGGFAVAKFNATSECLWNCILGGKSPSPRYQHRHHHYLQQQRQFHELVGRPKIQQQQRRSQSSSSSKKRNFKLDSLSFTVSPDQALAKFEKWAYEEQGLRYLLRWSSVRIAASYVPVYSFDVNLRFKLNDTFGWKPSMLRSAYPANQSIIHLPGLSTYAGHSYRRSLINPIHSTTLVFLGEETQPFGKWMLRDMKLSNGDRLGIFPDPWNATKGQALSIFKRDFEALAKEEEPNVEMQMEVTNTRRVYLPTFVIEYSIAGMEYQAFVSGCDEGAPISGASHQVWKNDSVLSLFSGFSSAVQVGYRTVGSRGSIYVLSGILQLLATVAGRLALRLPIIGVLAGVFVSLRKVIFPWVGQRYASAQWQREREQEARDPAGAATFRDDFHDYRQDAKRHFEKNRASILRELNGDNDPHRQGDFDWYKEWEEWARRQYEQQQQQQTYQQTYQQQQQQQQAYQSGARKQTSKKKEFKWDFNPDDPYSVLGVRRGASKSEISAAFRREMLKHHPDVQANATESEKERAVERSKHITRAYRTLKNEMK